MAAARQHFEHFEDFIWTYISLSYYVLYIIKDELDHFKVYIIKNKLDHFKVGIYKNLTDFHVKNV
jgi:hypothetical protein